MRALCLRRKTGAVGDKVQSWDEVSWSVLEMRFASWEIGARRDGLTGLWKGGCGGACFWTLIVLTRDFLFPGADRTRRFVLFRSRHLRSSSSWLPFSPVRSLSCSVILARSLPDRLTCSVMSSMDNILCCA